MTSFLQASDMRPCSPALTGRISPELEGMTVHKYTFVRINGVYQMYIAAFDQNDVWRLFYFEIAEENLFRLFD